MIYVLYNPLSNNKTGEEARKKIEETFAGKEMSFTDVRTISDSKEFISRVSKDDELIVAGGDGTISRFINEVYDLGLTQKIYYYPCGNGNDFANDVSGFVDKNTGLIVLNEFIKSLPVVSVNGMEKRFLNGIGFGIDGYCCEVGDDLHAKSDKPVNYAGIAIKGLLGKFKPFTATLTVDGKTATYKNVWLAPTMIGKYYGGGMMVTPFQQRLNKEKTVTAVVWHNKSKLGTLMAFPSIFKGEHIKKTKMVQSFIGHEVTVESDRPIALQIDGETVRNVTKYSVCYK